MSYYDDFSNYLHNPFGYPSEKQKMAIKYFTEKQDKDSNYHIIRQLSEIYRMPQHFGDINSLNHYGLKYHYNILKNYIIDNNLIGMVLYAANFNNHTQEDLFPEISSVQIYNTESGKKIILNVNQISQYLLKEYCDYYGDYNKGIESEVDTLSMKAVLKQLWIDYKE